MPRECFGDFVRIVNHPHFASIATNKLETFRNLTDSGISVPPWTDSKDLALEWLASGKTVLERHIINGSEGRGIIIKKPGEPLGDAPLYVRYIPKKKEFRVHIVGNAVIDIQQKVRKRNAQGPSNFLVRNTANGFIFVRNSILPPTDCSPQALAAVRSLGLDFGAVDVIWNEQQNKCFVLEVNTAPGIEGTTVAKYSEALRALCNM